MLKIRADRPERVYNVVIPWFISWICLGASHMACLFMNHVLYPALIVGPEGPSQDN